MVRQKLLQAEDLKMIAGLIEDSMSPRITAVRSVS